MYKDSGTIDTLELLSLVKPSPIAYFCAEFAVDVALPIYAGGLGILAGDLLAQAGEDSKAYVGVGLLYHKGYIHQQISKEANTFGEETFDYAKADLRLLTDKGIPLLVSLPIQGRKVNIQCWVKIVNGTPLLLLDTQVDSNEAQDSGITDRLYYGDREHRFKQEMILGIGGWRVLHAIGIVPRLYHLNEGHSALLFYELARNTCVCDKSVGVIEALEHINNAVFTNHTLIPAGNDVFSKDLVISYLSSYAMEFPIDPIVLTNFGLIQDSSLFSPTMLALRLATLSTAVSKLHAKKALEVWTDHPMIAITNGVRQAYWQSEAIRESSTDADLWRGHQEQKKKLCIYVKELTGTQWNENDLILGWARRLATYKRPHLLFDDTQRLKTIIQTSTYPVRIVMSGKPHPSDEQGMKNLEDILRTVGELQGTLVYIQDYNLKVALMLLSGIDVLFNTPIRGLEACGTSGMKASMNGVLQCTTLDGWTDEVDWKGFGWVLDDMRASSDIYTTLETEIIPLYEKREDAIPIEWVKRMKQTMATVIPHYTAKRMLDELEDLVYSTMVKG